VIAINVFNFWATLGLKDDGFQSGITKASGSAKIFAGGIKTLIGTVAGLKVISTAFNMITNSIGSAVERYDTLNRFPKVLQLMGYSASEATAATSKLSAGIEGLPTSLDEIISTAQRLTVLTGNLDESADTALALNNALIASGATTADVTRATNQYVQMLSKGKVDLVSWRTLQETMGYALREVSEALLGAGADSNDLYAALQNGTITFEQFNAMMIEMSETTGGFADMALEAAGGIGTAWTIMQTAITKGVTNIITSINDGLVDNALPGLEDAIKAVGKKGFEPFLTTVGNVMNGVIKVVSPVVKTVINNFDSIVKALKIAGTGFVGFKVAMDIKSAVSTFKTGMANMKKSIETTKFAQEMFTLAKEEGTAVDALALAMTDKSIASEGLRRAAKEAGLAVDTQGNIINAAGTKITESEAAAVLESAGALSAKQIIVGLVTGQVTLATAAQLLWNAAMSAMPFVAVVAGIGALVAGIVKLISKSKAVSKETQEFTDTLDSNIASRKESADAALAEVEANKKAADTLVNLSNKSSKTKDDIAQMSAQASILNDSFGETKIVVDQATGALNVSTDALYDMVDAMGKQAEAAAYLELYKEAIKDHAKAVQEQKKKIKEVNEAQSEQNEIWSVSGASTKTYGKDVQGLTNDLDELNTVVDESEEEIEFWRDAYTGTFEVVDDAVSSSVDSQISSLDDLTGAAKKLSDAYTSAFDEITAGYLDIGKEISAQNDLTADQMLANAKKRQQIEKDYNEARKKLVEFGFSEIQIMEMGYDEASMQGVIELANSKEDVLRDYLDTSVEIEKERERYVIEAIQNSGEPDAIKQLQLDEYNAANDTNYSCDWASVGEYSGTEVTSGFDEGLDLDSIIPDTMGSFTTIFGNEMWRTGVDSGTGLADGTGDGASGTGAALQGPLATAIQVAVDFASQLSSAVQPGLSQLNDNFVTAFTKVNDTVRNNLSTLKGTVTTMTMTTFSGMVSLVTTAMNTFKTVVSNTMTAVKTNMATVLSAINSSTESSLSTLQNTFKSKLEAITASVVAWGPLLSAAGKSAGNQLKDAITTVADSINLFSSGVNAVQGFINGALSKGGSLYNSMYNLFYQAKVAAQKALDEHSPSRELFKSGANSTQGFINGALSLKDKLYSTIEDMYSGITDGAEIETSLSAATIGSLSASLPDRIATGKEIQQTINNTQIFQAEQKSEYEQQKEAEAMLRRLRWT